VKETGQQNSKITVFAKPGIHLPHNSEEQARYGKIIASPAFTAIEILK